MTEINLSITERLVVMKTIDKLICHFEIKNKHGHWQGRAWFSLTKTSLDMLQKEMDEQ